MTYILEEIKDYFLGEDIPIITLPDLENLESGDTVIIPNEETLFGDILRTIAIFNKDIKVIFLKDYLHGPV